VCVCVCVSVCDLEVSIIRRTWPTRGCCAMEKNYLPVLISGLSNACYMIGLSNIINNIQ
jgi:hypothetical protein